MGVCSNKDFFVGLFHVAPHFHSIPKIYSLDLTIASQFIFRTVTNKIEIIRKKAQNY